jgi:hypothetical protein
LPAVSNSRWASAAPVLSGLLLVLLPKCPICAAAYLSFLSAFGVDRWAPSYLWPVSVALFAASLVFFAVRARRRAYYPPLLLLSLGAGLILLSRLHEPAAAWAWPGFALFAIGGLWSALRSPGPHRAPRRRRDAARRACG